MPPNPFASLAELSQSLASGEFTSRDLVLRYLDRIDALDAALHAFVEVWRDDALLIAEARDLERRARVSRGPLHGMPIAIKDLFHLDGRGTTAGATTWRGRIARTTATSVSRLLRAGMIPLGKTHMVEFAFGTWGTNVPMGTPRNPWDASTHRVAGGSSSGSAVAVAAGMAPIALGTDTGGSVRIPAALCGLTGLKPTYGVVSLHGVVPLAASLDSIGPIARSVDDAVLVTAEMAGPDPLDPGTLDVPSLRADVMLGRDPDLRGMRIAMLPEESLPAVVTQDVAQACKGAADVLRSLGATVDVRPFFFNFEELGAKNGRLIAAEGYTLHRVSIEDSALEFDPGVRRRLSAGKAMSAADYLGALAERREAQARFCDWMRGCDALLTPATPMPAAALEDVDETIAPMATFTRAVNFLGGCALALPAGFTTAGLPLGVQLIGAPHGEAPIVTIGRGFQRATDWHRQHPALPAR